MINIETFFGGADTTSSSKTLYRTSPRVLSCYNGSGITVTLPNPARYRANQRGTSHFVVLRHGAGSVAINRHDGTLLTTLSSVNHAAVIMLQASGFIALPRTIGTGRTVTHSTRDSIPVDEFPDSDDLNCFTGTPCDLAEVLESEPLDGEEGRDLCILPMCQDNIAHCRNSSREPIRAADVVMPSVVMVKFNRNAFAADPLHPLAATELGFRFFRQLYNNDKFHGLEYQGALNGVSRHPHHLRWQGTPPSVAWQHGTGLAAFTVKRHWWRALKTYTLPSGQEHEIEIRLVAEHTLGSEPGVDPVLTPGGAQDRDKGAWGTLFSLYVFCDELEPDFEDNDTHTPVGAGSPIPFTRADPFVSGAAYDVGETAADKYCHPQLVLVAHLPTTFQVPMGSMYVPLIDREYPNADGVVEGRNREFCYKVRNGSPWIDPGDCTGEYPSDSITGNDILGNIVFGWSISTHMGAAMTLGGDFDESNPTPYLVWENGLGVGRTYLQPLQPGWDESCGSLDIAGGSSGEIEFCIDDPDWPRYRLIECDGHPTEPFEGVGGGHKCFNNGNTTDDGVLQNCCIRMESALATVEDRCLTTITKYGDFTGLACEMLSNDFYTSGRHATTLRLQYEDHSYLMNGSQTLRSITWAALFPDPDSFTAEYTHVGTPDIDLVNEWGTWNFTGATISVDAGSHATSVKAAAIYRPAGVVGTRDSEGEVSFSNDTTAGVGFLIRFTENFGAEVTAYLLVVEPTSGSAMRAEIRKIVDDVETVLATVAFAAANKDTISITYSAWGAELILTYQVAAGPVQTLSVVDCEIETGEFGLALTTGGPVDLDDYSVSIDEKIFEEVSGAHGRYLNSLDWPVSIPESRKRFLNACDAHESKTSCGGCCTPPRCNCTAEGSTSYAYGSCAWVGVDMSYPDGRDVIAVACPADGDNPGACNSGIPRCECSSAPFSGCATNHPCGTNPEPFRGMNLCLPSCWQRDFTEYRMCSGVSQWYYSGETCA